MKILAPVGIIVLCIAAYFLYLAPASAEVSVLMQKKDYLNQVMDKVQELNKKREEISTTYNSISEQDVERLGKIIPEKFDPVQMVNDLSSLSANHKLAFHDFKSAPVNTDDRPLNANFQNGTPYRTTTVSFTLAGQYGDFLSFMKSIESSLRLFDVVSLVVEASSDTGKNGTGGMQYSIELNTYSLK